MAIKDWNGFKKSGDTYIPKDATARAGVTASVNLMKDTTGWTGKNKNKFKINTQESHGVTITRNADDSYTFTGVNDSALFQFFFFTREGTNNLELSAGRYTLVGGDSQIHAKISKTVNNAGQIIAESTGNAVEFDYSGTDAPYGFYLEVQAPVGTTFNKTISVMITTPEEYKLSPTYEPYHDSVELSKYNRSEANVLGAKNWFEVNAQSKTDHDVAITVNSDDSVTANGTATADAGLVLNTSGKSIPAGKYIVSTGTDAQAGVMVRYYATRGGQSVVLADINGTEQEITILDGDVVNAYLSIGNGKTVTNKTFYPMIRLATDTDPTYAPYAKTNRELTEMLTPTLLPNNADFNNYISEGEYFAGAGTYSNCPISSTAFRFKVMTFNAEATRCIQIIYANKPDPEVYMRTNFGGTWQSWYKFTGTVVS